MLQSGDNVVGTLRRPVSGNVVLNLKFMDSLRLVVAAPAEAQVCPFADTVQQAQSRAELRIRRQARIGLVVPAQAPFEDRAIGQLPAVGNIGAIAATLG